MIFLRTVWWVDYLFVIDFRTITLCHPHAFKMKGTKIMVNNGEINECYR